MLRLVGVMLCLHAVSSFQRLGRSCPLQMLAPSSVTRYHIDEATGPNLNVPSLVDKHVRKRGVFAAKHNVASYNRAAVDAARAFVAEFYRREGRGVERGPYPVILDSGCGTGRSTAAIASMYPSVPVIGLDRSALRLSRSPYFTPSADAPGEAAPAGLDESEDEEENNVEAVSMSEPLPNLLLLRCDVVDFWLLAAQDLVALGRWNVQRHFVLYPNPYPKAKHLKQRWHGHAVFPYMLQVKQHTRAHTPLTPHTTRIPRFASIFMGVKSRCV
jgi:tRNA (guanine-N7-)-methyltransferase